jgi:hypothetical protein
MRKRAGASPPATLEPPKSSPWDDFDVILETLMSLAPKLKAVAHALREREEQQNQHLEEQSQKISEQAEQIQQLQSLVQEANARDAAKQRLTQEFEKRLSDESQRWAERLASSSSTHSSDTGQPAGAATAQGATPSLGGKRSTPRASSPSPKLGSQCLTHEAVNKPRDVTKGVHGSPTPVRRSASLPATVSRPTPLAAPASTTEGAPRAQSVSTASARPVCTRETVLTTVATPRQRPTTPKPFGHGHGLASSAGPASSPGLATTQSSQSTLTLLSSKSDSATPRRERERSTMLAFGSSSNRSSSHQQAATTPRGQRIASNSAVRLQGHLSA